MITHRCGPTQTIEPPPSDIVTTESANIVSKIAEQVELGGWGPATTAQPPLRLAVVGPMGTVRLRGHCAHRHQSALQLGDLGSI